MKRNENIYPQPTSYMCTKTNIIKERESSPPNKPLKDLTSPRNITHRGLHVVFFFLTCNLNCHFSNLKINYVKQEEEEEGGDDDE